MTSPAPPAALPPEALAAAVDWAITSRRSVRAFLPTPVPRAEVEAILAVASRAPSGTNLQPWRVHVVTGEAKARLSRDVLAAHADPATAATHRDEWDYYPREWTSPYQERRRKVGLDLYGLLGIAKADRARMHAQFGRNYAFFDAPVGLLFVIDRVLQQGSFLDYGMFLQSIMVAARAFGLGTCPQAALCSRHEILQKRLGIPAEQMVLCGMALGYADPDAIVNTFVTERMALEEFVTFVEEVKGD
jgi:nitroreductase